MKKKNFMVFGMLIFALVLGTAVVHAITIVVDGVQDSVWDGDGVSQTPGVVSDPDEIAVVDSWDIDEFRFTNDQDNLYILFHTIDPTNWTDALGSYPYIEICIDVDSSDSTGFSYENCEGEEAPDGQPALTMDGIDRLIRIGNSGSGFVSQMFDESGSSITSSIVFATQGNINEASIDLDSLGIDGTNCIQTMQAGIYFDNRRGSNDDNVVDEGTFNLGCGSPTAVSLQSFDIASNNNPMIYFIIGFAALIVIGGVAFVLRREQKNA